MNPCFENENHRWGTIYSQVNSTRKVKLNMYTFYINEVSVPGKYYFTVKVKHGNYTLTLLKYSCLLHLLSVKFCKITRIFCFIIHSDCRYISASILRFILSFHYSSAWCSHTNYNRPNYLLNTRLHETLLMTVISLK